ncbi:FAD-dependent thymidylate synthase [Deinococcus cellulosilyticus]|uniref:Flavin-dependent thymidylate synthase n=1 Tax=Deinococcus cellulosilyticus (strain DSM 18568 / NBRC 106333 / KACC 11606 / 5516J-15) TaxID=1223518 RepID=A0A511N3U5_DEIC1|nr:FAD-dependent thymidylate synthase [Deinococcus cellulosilyticus]GEM47086.1 flavin-dependent thymidylate synthase [Deinococcus cellulosilyticus NBRC 106333 = KACC 11606]
MTQTLSEQDVLFPLNDGIGSVALIQHVGDDKSVVNAARVSFGGDNRMPLDEKDARLIRYLLKHQHGSPFEHNSLTFKIVAPIFVVRQWMRHRVGVSYNEISGRYVEIKDQFYTPGNFRQQAKSNRQASIEATDSLNQEKAHEVWEAAWKNAYEAYQQLLSLGVTREQARGVLPLTMYTEFYFTCNLRSLFHFLALRDHPGAQWETQMYARALAQLSEPLFPSSFEAWRSLNAHE